MSSVLCDGNGLQRLLECPICLEKYTNPRVLPCQHTLCLSPCLERLVQGTNGFRKIQCPQCRAEHALPADELEQFPRNLTVVTLLDLEISDSFAAPVSVMSAAVQCSNTECPNKEELEVCSHCSSLLCNVCRAGHFEALSVEVEELNKKFIEAKSASKTVAAANLQARLLDVERSHVGIEKKITQQFQKVQTSLTMDKEALLKQVQQHKQMELKKTRDAVDPRMMDTPGDLAWDPEFRNRKESACTQELLALRDELQSKLLLVPTLKTPFVQLDKIACETNPTPFCFARVVFGPNPSVAFVPPFPDPYSGQVTQTTGYPSHYSPYPPGYQPFGARFPLYSKLTNSSSNTGYPPNTSIWRQ